MRGRINGLGLNGDFLIELELKPEELRNWLTMYVQEQPEDAFKLLSELKAEALIQLLQKPTAKEPVPDTT